MSEKKKTLTQADLSMIFYHGPGILNVSDNFYREDQNGKYVEINSCEISDPGIVHEFNEPDRSIIFRNCVIEQLNFEDISAKEVLFFECSINTISFESFKIRRIQFDSSTVIQSLNIERNYRFSDETGLPLDILSYGKLNDLRIDGFLSHVRVILKMRIEEIYIAETPNYFIATVHVIQKLELSKCKYTLRPQCLVNLLIMHECELDHQFQGIFDKIYILGGYLRQLYFKSFKCTSVLSIESLKTDDDTKGIFFFDAYIPGDVSIHRVNALIKIYGFNNNTLYINSLTLNEGRYSFEYINDNKVGNAVVSRIVFNDVSIPSNGKFNFIETQCEHILMKRFKNWSVGYMDNVIAKKISAPQPTFESLAKNPASRTFAFFREVTLEEPTIGGPTFILENSDLGRLNFINTDLSMFEMRFASSKMYDISFVGSQMPTIILPISEIKTEKFIQLQAANSQLKKIYEQHGDFVQANKYFANEMNAYYDSLKWKKGTRTEIINLWLNRYSSNHGQSWKRGLISTASISLFFYFLFCMSLGIYPDRWNSFSLGFFGTVISYIFEFMNPIHKLESFKELTLDGDQIGAMTRIIDGISRIFIGYCIYQLIAAFRKHGKSK